MAKTSMKIKQQRPCLLYTSCFHYFYSITDAALIVLIMSFQLNGFLNDLTDHWVLYVVLDCYNDG